MSDHDAAPDPVDRAYAQAEALLADEAARAARRARVLGAVAREVQPPVALASSPSRPRPAWARGGWLAAASVAGLSALVAVQAYKPPVAPQAPPHVTSEVAAGPAQAIATPPPPAARERSAAPTATASVSRDEARSPRDVPAVKASPPPPPPVQPAPATPEASADVSDVVVTASRSQAPQAPAPAAMGAAAPAVPAGRAARLRAAAAAGRIAELSDLLAQGGPVDTPDEDGETALMKAVNAVNPAAVALLRRHGASLDLRNRAGKSARDLAASIDDPELNRSLGLAP